MRRIGAVGAVLAALLAVTAAPVAIAADSNGSIEVFENQQALPIADLSYDTLADSEDLTDGQNHIANRGQEPSVNGGPSTTGVNGVSLEHLVELAGVDPDHLTGDSLSDPAVVVSAHAGQEAPDPVTRSEVIDGFTDPLQPPGFPLGQAVIFPYDEQELYWVRPMRTSDDPIEWEGNSSVMSVELNVAGAVLNVSITGPTQGDAGQSLTFTALPGDGTGSGWQYTWDFNDESPAGAPSTSTTASHAFEKGGTYAVTVTATDPNGGGGVSQPLRVTITPATTTQTTSTTSTTTTGPTQPGSARIPVSGSAQGPSSGPDTSPDRTNSPGTHKSGNRTNDRKPRTQTTQHKTQTQTSPSQSPTGVSSGGGGGAGGGSGGGQGGSTSGTAAGATHGSGSTSTGTARAKSNPSRSLRSGSSTRTPRSPATAKQHYRRVTGLLMAADTHAIAPQRLDQQTQVVQTLHAQAAEVGAASGGVSIWGLLVGLLVLAGLLCGGGAAEVRSLIASRRAPRE